MKINSTIAEVLLKGSAVFNKYITLDLDFNVVL